MRQSIAASAAALTAALLLSVGTTANAKVQVSAGQDREVVIGKDNADLLEELIALDAKGIADMQADFADARREVDEAVGEVTKAREETRGVPFARFIVRMAFASAAEATTEASREGFAEAHSELARAETDLRVAKVSPEERTETQGAINMIRGELSLLEASLERLSKALHDGAR